MKLLDKAINGIIALKIAETGMKLIDKQKNKFKSQGMFDKNKKKIL